MAETNVVSLTPWDITVKGATQRARAQALLGREDADEAIRALSELEAYYVVKALGADDAIPVLAVIGPEQTQTLLDLEAWRAGRFHIDDLLVWLDAFREAGLEQLQAAVRVMDEEALALLLRRRLLISSVPHDEDDTPSPDWVSSPTDDILPVIQTADRRFYIAARSVDEWDELEEEEGNEIDEEERKAIVKLVEDLYRQEDWAFISAALRQAEAGLASELEDSARHFREARLEDLGFPPLDRAVAVYAPRDADSLLAQRQARSSDHLRLPALHAGHLDAGLFHAALRQIDSPSVVREIEAELVALANAVLVADGIDAGQLEALTESLTRIREYIELALKHRAPGSLEVAVERLEQHPIRALFSAGHAIALALKTRAQRLPLRLLTEQQRALVEPLLARRPRVVDVAAVEGVLAEVEPLVALGLAPIRGRVAPPTEEQTLEDLFTTLVARALLGKGATLEALTRTELAELAARAPFLEGEIGQAVRDVLGEGAAVTLGRPLRDLSDSLAAVSGDVDPRFIGGLVRRLDE